MPMARRRSNGTSKKMEIKLTQVARASLEELRLDYEDFLRHRGLPLWDGSDARRQNLVDRRCATVEEVADWVKEMHQNGRVGRSGQTTPPRPSAPSTASTAPTYAELAANAVLTLINVATALLDRQIGSLARAFEQKGGFTEHLYRLRSQQRRRS